MTLPGKRTVLRLKRIILCILCVLTALFLAVGCDLIGIKPSGDGGTEPTPTPTPTPTPEPEPEPDPEPVYYTVTFKNEKTQNAETLLSLKVEEGKELSEEQIASFHALSYHGYTFSSWYVYQGAVRRVLFNPTERITEDTVVYGDRGNYAGQNITYTYDSVQCKLTLTGEGEMFSFFFREDVPWHTSRKNIKTVEIDPRITTIANYAFYECVKLEKVVLPEGIHTIGKGAFKESGIADINFPSTLVRIAEAAFDTCLSLETLNLNAGLTNIENYAFANCANIRSMVFTDSILKCDTSAFLHDNALASAYYIGTEEALKKVQVAVENFWLFDLANIYYISEEKPAVRGPYWHYDEGGNIRQWYRTVSFYATRDAKLPFLYDYVDTNLGMDEENVQVYQNIVYHGYRFASWNDENRRLYDDYRVGTRLTSDLRLYGNRGNLCGDSMTWRRNGNTLMISGSGRMWDFEGYTDAPWYAINNSYITEIVIDENITYIGKNAFADMIELTSLRIPVGVTEISPSFIVGCRKLLYVYYEGTTEQLAGVVGSDAASLPAGRTYEIYARYNAADTGDGNYYVEIADPGRPYRTSVPMTWAIHDGVLTVGGDATMANFNTFSEAPWAYLADRVRELRLRENIHTIGHHTFDGLTGVTKITLPSSGDRYYSTVQSYRISATAFSGTAFYNDPENYTADGALYIGCFLIRVDPSKAGELFLLREGTEAIAEDAFAGCDGIRSMVFYSSADSGVYSSALSGLTGLTHLYYYRPSGDATELPAALDGKIPETATVCFFRSKAPAATESGDFWHFDRDGNPVLWQTAEETA